MGIEEKEHTIQNWKPLIISICKKYTRDFPVEDSDLYQECCIKFLKCVELFDPKYEVKFITYLHVAITRCCQRFQQDECERRKKFKCWPPENEEWHFDDQLLAVDYRDNEKSSASVDLHAMMQDFEPRTKKIMKMHLEGHTLASISKKHKISRERVRQILEKTKNQIISKNNWDCS